VPSTSQGTEVTQRHCQNANGRGGKKAVLFCKKEPKNLYVFSDTPAGEGQEIRVFWFFFAKKNRFLP
jgi:hypothetical protein